MLASRILRVAGAALFSFVFISCGGGGSSQVAPGAPEITHSAPFNVAGFSATLTEYPVPAGVFPFDVTIGPDKALWFGNGVNFGNPLSRTDVMVGEVNSGGSVTVYTVSSPFTAADGVLASSNGKIWGTGNDTSTEDEAFLFEITPHGAVTPFTDLELCCGSPRNKFIRGFDGNLWATVCSETCGNGGAVNSIPIPGGTGIGHAVSLNTATEPYASHIIANGPDHNFYVTATFTGPPPGPSTDSQVVQISPGAVILNRFLLPDGSEPDGITAGADGNLWIAERGTNKIARMTITGSFTEFPVPTAHAGPHAITAGSDGALWFTEFDAGQIGRITTAGVITEYPIGTPNAHPQGIVTCPSSCENAHGRIWFAEDIGDSPFFTSGKIGKIEF